MEKIKTCSNAKIKTKKERKNGKSGMRKKAGKRKVEGDKT
jgi:hypothetical protein